MCSGDGIGDECGEAVDADLHCFHLGSHGKLTALGWAAGLSVTFVVVFSGAGGKGIFTGGFEKMGGFEMVFCGEVVVDCWSGRGF